MNTLNRLPTATLAGFQQSQGKSNSCALYTIATLLNIHFGFNLQGAALAKKIDDTWKTKPFYYRMAPNWATTPRQARRVLRRLACQEGFSLQTRLTACSEAYLQDTLTYSRNIYPIVTFIWFANGPRLLTRRMDEEITMHAASGFGAHTMLLAAYDPAHTDQHGLPFPWGFINSWADETITDLFWMDAATWQRLPRLKTLLVSFGSG